MTQSLNSFVRKYRVIQKTHNLRNKRLIADEKLQEYLLHSGPTTPGHVQQKVRAWLGMERGRNGFPCSPFNPEICLELEVLNAYYKTTTKPEIWNFGRLLSTTYSQISSPGNWKFKEAIEGFYEALNLYLEN